VHLIVLSRIFFRSPDLSTAREFVAGLLALDSYGIRDGFLTPWLAAALVGGLAYHFTPKEWVERYVYGAFKLLPGFVLGYAFLRLCYFLMGLMEGTPRPFIYFNF
jgi:hypothetical protein